MPGTGTTRTPPRRPTWKTAISQARRAFPATAAKELEAHYNEIFTTFLKDAHRTDTVRSIRFLTPEIASVDIDWQMTGARTRDGKDAPNRKGLLTWVVTKQHNGQWMITIYHESAF